MSATLGINDADKNLWNIRGFLLSFTLNCLNKVNVCRNLDESCNSPIFLPLSWSGGEALPHITCVSENAKTSSRAKSQATASAVCRAGCFHCCHMLCVLPALKFVENNSQSSLSCKWMQLLRTKIEAFKSCVDTKLCEAFATLIFLLHNSFHLNFVKSQQNISYCYSLHRFPM